MSPYRIEMVVCSYNKRNEPFYKVNVYDKTGRLFLSSGELTKEKAIKHIAGYCCVTL